MATQKRQTHGRHVGLSHGMETMRIAPTNPNAVLLVAIFLIQMLEKNAEAMWWVFLSSWIATIQVAIATVHNQNQQSKNRTSYQNQPDESKPIQFLENNSCSRLYLRLANYENEA